MPLLNDCARNDDAGSPKRFDKGTEGTLGQIAGTAWRCQIEPPLTVAAEPPRSVNCLVDAKERLFGVEPASRKITELPGRIR